MTTHEHSRPHRARGFTLVEALVALLVLSVGLLGIASLQLSSLRWNQGAEQRTQATLLAYDILDRMRANKADADAGNYTITVAQSATAGATVVSKDLATWKQNLARTLPGGNGSVALNTTARALVYTITVQWDDTHSADPNGNPATDPPVTFTMVSEL